MQLLNLFNGVIIGGFLISTGFSLYLWKNKIEKEINRAFSFLGIFITVYLLLTLLNYKHASPANFIIFDKLVNYTLLLCGLSLIILIRHITGYKNNTHPVVIYASFGILAIVNAIAPAGLSYASVSSMHPVILPWGEVIYSPVPQPSSFQYVVIGFIIYVLYFNIVAFKYAYKQGQKESINKVVWAVSFGLGSLALDNLLIMNGVYHLLFLDSLSFFFFIILIYQRNLASVIHSNKLQSELSENEKTMKFIIEGSNDGIWDWNMQSNKVKVSDRYLAMTGYSKAEFPEDMSAWLEIVHPEDKERLAGDLEKFFISDRKKTESEYRVITKQGSWMWINSRIFLAEAAEDGRPLRAIGSSSDITERKKAEEKTKRSEARFKTLAEATFEGIALVKDEIITDVNKQFCDLFGYGKKELQGKNIRELLNANSPAVSLDNMNVIGLAPFEIGGIRKDGSTVPLEIRSRTVLHGDGNLNVCIFRDLSFQKEAESALLQSEEKFRRLFEFSPTANIVVDQTPQHHIVAINKAGLLLLACDMQYALKHTLADFYGAQITGKIFSKIQQEGDLDKYEITITDKSDNGKIVNLYSRKVILGNEPTTFLLIDDITQQRHAEMRLSNSLTYIDSLVNSLPFGIISTDINLGVNTFNDAALQFLQAPEDMQNKYLFDKFKKLLFVQHKISIALLGQELMFEAVEYDEFTPSMDMTRHYSFSVIPLQFQLDPGYVIIIENITEKRKMEQAMIQSEKVLSVAGLAAGMAHEINNPLGTIVQGCQNLLRRMSDELPKNKTAAENLGVQLSVIQQYFHNRQLFEVIESMRSAAQRASEIIKNMLQFSRKSESKKVLCSINKIVTDSLELAESDFDLKKKYDFRNISIVLDFGKDLPSVYATITEIEQVLLNIIRNAAQAFIHDDSTKPKPVLTLRTYSENTFVCLDIIDNGPGIHEKVLGRIFEPFFTTKDIGEGTGLGLSVAYMIVHKNHSGVLTAESKVGKGSRFTIKLPGSRQETGTNQFSNEQLNLSL